MTAPSPLQPNTKSRAAFSLGLRKHERTLPNAARSFFSTCIIIILEGSNVYNIWTAALLAAAVQQSSSSSSTQLTRVSEEITAPDDGENTTHHTWCMWRPFIRFQHNIVRRLFVVWTAGIILCVIISTTDISALGADRSIWTFPHAGHSYMLPSAQRLSGAQTGMPIYDLPDCCESDFWKISVRDQKSTSYEYHI